MRKSSRKENKKNMENVDILFRIFLIKGDFNVFLIDPILSDSHQIANENQ